MIITVKGHKAKISKGKRCFAVSFVSEDGDPRLRVIEENEIFVDLHITAQLLSVTRFLYCQAKKMYHTLKTGKAIRRGTTEN